MTFMKRFVLIFVVILFSFAMSEGKKSENLDQWEEMETEHFILKYKPAIRTSALEIAEEAERIFNQVIVILDYYPSEKIIIFIEMSIKDIEETHKDYFGVRCWSPSPHTVFMVVSPFWTTDSLFYQGLDGYIAQWLTYDLITQRLSNSASVLPEWFTYGLANYSVKITESQFMQNPDIYMKIVWEKGDFKNLIELDNTKNRILIGFEGLFVFTFLEEEYGKKTLDNFINMSLQYGDPYSSIESVLGIEVQEFEEQWKKWLQRSLSGVQVEPVKSDILITQLSDFVMMQIPTSWGEEGILFISGWTKNLDVYIIENTGEKKKLTESEENDTDAQFSQNEKKIAFTSLEDGYYNIYVMDSDGSNLEKITDDQFINCNPAFSPDGTIAFVSDRSGNYDIFVMDGQEFIQLTVDPAQDGNPSFSPDGSTLVFSSNRNGNFNLYLLDLKNRIITQLTDTPEDEFLPSFSPDGTQIVFTRLAPQTRVGSEIWVTDLQGSERFLAEGFYGVWSPDGKKIAFGSSFDGSPADIYIGDLREERSYFTMPVLIAVLFIVLVFSVAMYLIFLRK